ncbi:unnamed protein product [Lymnaea stagnalis]|uniref:CCD97-like C-terminal domain-containing protein n=1 Tax=Lymnaea stagnalis TaxID=6523 RepID=A0AAV2I7F6_LYMST
MSEAKQTLNSIKGIEKQKEDMIQRLVRTDAHFKHQQRGEPDLTFEEKSNIALDVFKKSPALFLERFSKFLTLEDTEYFSELKGDYRIDFYVQEIVNRCKDTNKSVIKNRRYRALQELMDEGEYFSEEEMKWRDPLLFEQMIGQYASEAEKTEQMEQDIDRSDLKFSTILLKHMDTQVNKQFFEQLKEKEEEQEEEEEEEDSDEEGDVMEEDGRDKEAQGSEEKDTDLTTSERSYLRTEFLRIMQERFLSGEDSGFDYSKVDSNADYDSLDILGHDAEEKYFDDDNEQLCEGDELTDSREDTRWDRLLRRRIETMGLKTDEEIAREMIDEMGDKPLNKDDMSYPPCETITEYKDCS